MPSVQRPQLSITQLDYSKESTTTSYYVDETIDTTYTANFAAFTALVNAEGLLTTGSQYSIVQEMNRSVQVPPVAATSPFSQRELRWRVRYRDLVTEKEYSFTIGCPELTGNLKPGTDEADLDSAAWLGYIAEFEATARSVDGNNVMLLGATLIGRSN